jgi:2-C-methyl-D-erythritol 4-phosphate cytidylyltransferase
MSLSDIFHRVSKAGKYVSAIIACAGSGTRMGDSLGCSKQCYELDGIPVAVRSLLAFQACDTVDEIILVCREDEVLKFKQLCDEYGIKKLRKVVVGGETRQESVFNGFESISPQTKYVAIHDAARCLVTPEMITKVLTEAFANRAACAGCTVHDTIKIIRGDKNVESTPDRSRVMLAQTPQCFYADMYRAAAYTARDKGFVATDDSSLVEAAGFDVRMVDCGHENIKLTTPEDIEAAELILKRRSREAVADK